MEGEIQKTVRDHRIGNLRRTRDIVNGRAPAQPSVEEILAEEEKRLGVKLEIKKP
jgi:hypothetical protein